MIQGAENGERAARLAAYGERFGTPKSSPPHLSPSFRKRRIHRGGACTERAFDLAQAKAQRVEIFFYKPPFRDCAHTTYGGQSPEREKGESKMHTAHFEVINQSGQKFGHFEEFRICGLARVRVREEKDKAWRDWSGTVRKYRASSSRPFVVCVVSDHTMEGSDGTTRDFSEVRVVKSEETLQ